MNLLKFHKEIVTSLMTNGKNKTGDGDGLVIMSKGLGLRKVLLTFLNIYSHSKNLVLLLNTSQPEVEELQIELNKLQRSKKKNFLKIINNETPSSERYRNGK